jgi:hypothetical protein
MTRKAASVFAFSIVCLAALSVSAQTISADRPGATDAASTVPKSALQIEAGFEASRNGSVQSALYPLMVARLGITEAFELRLAPPGSVSLNGSINGTDPSVGFKVSGKMGDVGTIGFLAEATLPAVNPGTGSVLYARGTASFDLGGPSLAVTLGGNYGRFRFEDNQADVEGLAAVAFGVPVVEDVGAYIEVYSGVTDEPEFSPVVDGGVTYLLTPWLQLDAYVGVGLLQQSPDWLTGMGVAFLVPSSALDDDSEDDDDASTPEPTETAGEF